MLMSNQALRSRVNFARVVATATVVALSALLPFSARAQKTTPDAADFVSAASDAGNWILPAKSYADNPFTPATEITPQNAAGLKQIWNYVVKDDAGPLDSAPLVWHSMMFFISAHDHVYALDAATGKLKWEFAPQAKGSTAAGHHGLALYEGNVYEATQNGHLIAIDAGTGKSVWDAAAVPESGFSTAPMPYDNTASGQDLLLIGIAPGGPQGSGALAAFSPKDGHRLWQWNTVPGPGAPGHDSWSGESWQRGGVPVVGIAVDPDTQTAFVSLGSAAPIFDGAAREGANLYSDSVVAILLSASGPQFHGDYQLIPHDTHGWGEMTAPLLFHGRLSNQPRDLIAVGDRGGNVWFLDPSLGHVLNRSRVSFQKSGETVAAAGGAAICPAFNGGVARNGGVFDPETNIFFVPSAEECIAVKLENGKTETRRLGPNRGAVNAIDVMTGILDWRKHLDMPIASGVLATAGGVVFTSELRGRLEALDARSGRVLWRMDLASPSMAPPISYMVNGHEVIAIASSPVSDRFKEELHPPNNKRPSDSMGFVGKSKKPPPIQARIDVYALK